MNMIKQIFFLFFLHQIKVDSFFFFFNFILGISGSLVNYFSIFFYCMVEAIILFVACTGRCSTFQTII